MRRPPFHRVISGLMHFGNTGEARPSSGLLCCLEMLTNGPRTLQPSNGASNAEVGVTPSELRPDRTRKIDEALLRTP